MYVGCYDFVVWGYNFDLILCGVIFNSCMLVMMCFDEVVFV